MSEIDKYRSKAKARAICDIEGDEYPESRFYIKSDIWDNLSKNFRDGYIVAWRSLTSATNRRTMLATALPLIPTCQSVQLLQMDNIESMIQILAVFNSIIFDYIVRLKMAGLDLTQTIVKQIPVPSAEKYEECIVFCDRKDSIMNHIVSRLRYLYKSDVRVSGLFEGYNTYNIPDKPRKQVIAELDRLAGRLYGLSPGETGKIAACFDKYYTKQELEQWF